MNVIYKQGKKGEGLAALIHYALIVFTWLSLLVGLGVLTAVTDPADSRILDFAIRNRVWIPVTLSVIALLGAATAAYEIAGNIRRLARPKHSGGPHWGSDGLFATGPGGGGPPVPPPWWKKLLRWIVPIVVLAGVVAAAYGAVTVSKSDQTDFMRINEDTACQTRDFHMNRKVLVFIHGFMGDADGTWVNFPRLVSEDERMHEFNICAVDYQTYITRRNLDIDGAADFIIGQLETNWGKVGDQNFGTRARYDEVDVIAHSMGGLVSRVIEYRDYRDHKRPEFDKIVEIATPHAGSPAPSHSFVSRLLAWIGVFPELEDMEVGSAYLKTLQGDWDSITPAPIDFCIGSQTDVYAPVESAIYDCDQARVRKYDGGDHTALVKPDSRNDIRYETPINLLLGVGTPAGADVVPATSKR